LEGRTIIVGGRQQVVPPDFESIDRMRRKFGETFKGKPPVGYEGIDANYCSRHVFQIVKNHG
jgi:hypothetical protein